MIEHPIPTLREIKEAMHTIDMLIVAAEDGRLPIEEPGAVALAVTQLTESYVVLVDIANRLDGRK